MRSSDSSKENDRLYAMVNKEGVCQYKTSAAVTCREVRLFQVNPLVRAGASQMRYQLASEK